MRVLPEIVSPTEQQVGLGEERRSDLAEPAVAARALEAVLVPVAVDGAQQVALGDDAAASGTLLHLHPGRRVPPAWRRRRVVMLGGQRVGRKGDVLRQQSTGAMHRRRPADRASTSSSSDSHSAELDPAPTRAINSFIIIIIIKFFNKKSCQTQLHKR